MPILKITRVAEPLHKARNIKIFVDGIEVGVIAHSERGTFEMKEGRHTLQAKIDWCTSPLISFDIADRKILHYELSSFMYSASGSSSYLMLRLYNFTIGYLYYATIGRDRYLVLKEKNFRPAYSLN